PGAFVRTSGPWFAGRRGGWRTLVFVGAVSLGLLGLLCWVASPRADRDSVLPHFQTGLAAVGLLLLLPGVVRFLRPRTDAELGSFLFADGAYLWDVNANRVVILPLCELEDVDGHTHRYGSGPNYTSVRLRFTFGPHRWAIRSATAAGRLVDFLTWLLALRRSASELIQQRGRSSGWLPPRPAQPAGSDRPGRVAGGAGRAAPARLAPPPPAPGRGRPGGGLARHARLPALRRRRGRRGSFRLPSPQRPPPRRPPVRPGEGRAGQGQDAGQAQGVPVRR